MTFRLKAFGLHLLCSATVLGSVLGILYLGWYRWPGWYAVGVSSVIVVLIGVDLTLGPLFTFIVARSTKTRRVLARDIAIIATVQLCALICGTVILWTGRPLYYAFSTSVVTLVQAYDINAHQVAVAREQNKVALLPHWYSLPRWIWAPLPADPKEAESIVASAVFGGDDVVDMPRFFRPWEQGLPELRKRLQKVDDVVYFTKSEKQALKQRMRALGLDGDQLNAMTLSGRGEPVLLVFDPASLKIRATLTAPSSQLPGPNLRMTKNLWMMRVQAYFRKLLGHRARTRQASHTPVPGSPTLPAH
jgi:hypothetical protein